MVVSLYDPVENANLVVCCDEPTTTKWLRLHLLLGKVGELEYPWMVLNNSPITLAARLLLSSGVPPG